METIIKVKLWKANVFHNVLCLEQRERNGYKDETSGCYSAIGNSGNVIYVNPSKGIVIAVTSYFKPTIFDRVDFIEKVITPSILK